MNKININGKVVSSSIVHEPNSDQLDALNHLALFLESDKNSTVLSGSAGTGKTFSTKLLLDYISQHKKDISVVLAAPTHKAKSVLGRLSDKGGATTIHKLLGLRPDVSIVDFDAKDMRFVDNMKLDFLMTDTLYIIDECSMINNFLYDLLIRKMCVDGNKILFLGDLKQLKPVKQEKISKVFTETDYPGFTLTKIERQSDNSVLTDVLEELRDQSIKSFKQDVAEDSSIRIYNSARDFMSSIKRKMFDFNFAKQPFEYKVLAYTNSRVLQFNEAIRKVSGFKGVLEKGEVMMGYDNYTPNFGKSKGKTIIHNSNDYIVIDVSEEEIDIPFYNLVRGYRVTLLDTVDRNSFVVNLIDPKLPDKIYKQISNILEEFRLRAIDRNKSAFSRKNNWSYWYKMKDSFVSMIDLVYEGRVIKKASLNYGYATTVHRSQGSTYNEVFIDMSNILKCPNKLDLRPLQYVAASRARKHLHILQEK